jgi:hypothetical protein
MINPKDVEEALKPMSIIENELPESPMSIHIDTYYKGFHSGITIRMMDNTTIPTSRIMRVIDSLIGNGFQPSWNVDTNIAHSTPAPVVSQPVTPQPQVQPSLGVCPKCGAPLKEAKTKTGMVFTKCSTNGWDKVNKKSTGCDYVKWPEKE